MHLVDDPVNAPFNVATRIHLGDFERHELVPLRRGLSEKNDSGDILLDRIYYWTHGHPYMTQKLCKAVARRKAASEEDVDQICNELFLSLKACENDDNLILLRERLLRSSCDLDEIRKILGAAMKLNGVPYDSQNEIIQNIIETGLLTVGTDSVVFRNRIYESACRNAWQSFIG